MFRITHIFLAYLRLSRIIQTCLTEPIVTLKNGTYTGIHNSVFNQDVFLGIPFAKQPVGQLRLRVPQSLDTTWTGTLPAATFGNSCPQPPFPPFTTPNMVYGEDCLTLNVVRPAGIPHTQKLPVAVWIHGGGFFIGGSAWPYYNLSTFVSASQQAGQPILALSLNYRLGILGFLSGSELTAEGNVNLGLHDQRLALRWIKENIASFGGDPEKVTIFGESAGGMSVACQMAMYGGRDNNLFRGAILESGSISILPWEKSDSEKSNAVFGMIATRIECGNVTDKVECIRRAPYQKIIEAFDVLPTSSTPILLPTIDGNLFHEHPIKSFKEGRVVKVPTIIGTTQDEGSIISTPPPINTDADIRHGLAAWFPYFTHADRDEILRLYSTDPSQGVPYGRFGNTTFPSLGLQWRRYTSIGGDMLIISPARWSASVLSCVGLEVYKYRFNVSTNLLGFPDYFGATHSVEIPYVFNVPELRQKTELSKVVDVMSRTWVSFVNSLTPNGHGLDGVPFWVPYNRKKREFFIGLEEIGMKGDNYRQTQINFINSAILMNAGVE